MSQIGGRQPFPDAGSFMRYTPSGVPEPLSATGLIPPDCTGALIQSDDAAFTFCFDFDFMQSNWAGLTLAHGDTLTIDNAADLRAFCFIGSHDISIQFFTGPIGLLPEIQQASNGGGGGGGAVNSVTGPDVNNSDPANPYVNPTRISTNKILWVAPIGSTLYYPPQKGYLSRPYFSVNDAIDAYNYANGEIIVLLPGNHQISKPNIGSVTIHMMGANLAGNLLTTAGSIIKISGTGALTGHIDSWGDVIDIEPHVMGFTARTGAMRLRNDVQCYLHCYGGMVQLDGSILGLNIGGATRSFEVQTNATAVVKGNIYANNSYRTIGFINGTATVNGFIELNQYFSLEVGGKADLNDVLIKALAPVNAIQINANTALLTIRGRVNSGTSSAILSNTSNAQIRLMPTAVIAGGLPISATGPLNATVYSTGATVTNPLNPIITVNGNLFVYPWA